MNFFATVLLKRTKQFCNLTPLVGNENPMIEMKEIKVSRTGRKVRRCATNDHWFQECIKTIENCNKTKITINNVAFNIFLCNCS